MVLYTFDSIKVVLQKYTNILSGQPNAYFF